MAATLLITLREGLEATLIVGIVLGILDRMSLAARPRYVWLGVVAAVVVSLVGGIGLHTLGIAFEGRGEEIFEGLAVILAAGVLTWMIFWMQGQGKQLQDGLESDVAKAVTTNSHGAIFSLAFIAVVREGIETALFLTAAAFSTTSGETLFGGSIGLLLAIVLGWLLFTAGKRLSIRPFFRITGFLLLLFAAGLLAHGIHELQEAVILPVIIEHLYNINPLLDEKSFLGTFLKTLFGYNDNPSLLESLVYVGYITAIYMVSKIPGRKSAQGIREEKTNVISVI